MSSLPAYGGGGGGSGEAQRELSTDEHLQLVFQFYCRFGRTSGSGDEAETLDSFSLCVAPSRGEARAACRIRATAACCHTLPACRSPSPCSAKFTRECPGLLDKALNPRGASERSRSRAVGPPPQQRAAAPAPPPRSRIALSPPPSLPAEVDLIFMKCKQRAARRITYSQFLDALSAMAALKYPDVADPVTAFSLLLGACAARLLPEAAAAAARRHPAPPRTPLSSARRHARVAVPRVDRHRGGGALRRAAAVRLARAAGRVLLAGGVCAGVWRGGGGVCGGYGGGCRREQ